LSENYTSASQVEFREVTTIAAAAKRTSTAASDEPDATTGTTWSANRSSD
jgi:hypothetical protein